jgi:circadian clock protein KaiC
LSGEGSVSTGVANLDMVLSGGFRPKSVILVSGNPGSGKTIFSTQFLLAGTRIGERGLYVSFAERKEDYYTNMETLGLDVNDPGEKGLFKFIDFPTLDEEGMKEAADVVTKEIMDYQPRRLVVDSISAFTQSMGKAETRQFLHVLFGRILKDLDVTTLLIGEIPLGESKTGFGVEEFIADGVILLKYSRTGKTEKREMEIPKMRGVPVMKSSYEYTIDKRYGGIGLIVLPIQAPIEEMPKEKITTGVKGLDKMLIGGVYRGSITLVEGETGIGKTTLCAQFLIENARRGERSLFLSFEEPVGQIRRQLDGLKFNYRELDGLIIESYVPEALTPLHYYGLVKEAVDDIKPTVLAIDSITAIQHTLKEDDFIEFIRYLQLLSKEKSLTVFLTALIKQNSSVTGISTLADNVIVMTYYQIKDRISREISVMKTRGSPHERRVMEFQITDHGIFVSD